MGWILISWKLYQKSKEKKNVCAEEAAAKILTQVTIIVIICAFNSCDIIMAILTGVP